MTRKDQVAELMSEGKTPNEIQSLMGLTKRAFYKTFAQIRKDLGCQAQ